MARSAKEDPIEKFRFKVTILAFQASINGLIDTLADSLANQHAGIKVFSRAGFNRVTTPKVTINEISYRENIDNARFIKVPGLAKYEPITLSRGVTSSRDLYDWFRLVNEEIALLATAQELQKDAQYSVTQSDNFRKDVVIEVLDREGKPVKSWYLFNAWPSAYSPGNDLDANSDEKLIEELTLSYEFFIELEGGIEGFAKEIAKGVFTGVATALANKYGLGGSGGLGF